MLWNETAPVERRARMVTFANGMTTNSTTVRWTVRQFIHPVCACSRARHPKQATLFDCIRTKLASIQLHYTSSCYE